LVTMMAHLQFLSSTLSTTTTPSEALELGDAVYTAAIALLRGLLLRDAAAVPLSPEATAAAEKYKKYSRHLLQLLPSATAAETPTASLAEECYLHGVPLTSSAAVSAAVTIERLHQERLRFLASHATSRVRVTLLVAAAGAAVRDFPLNHTFLTQYCKLKASLPGGSVSLRAYFKEIAITRHLWGGGLTAAECVSLVWVEVTHAAQNAMRGGDMQSVASLGSQSATAAVPPTARGDSPGSVGNAAQSPLSTMQHWTVDDLSRVRAALEYVLSTPPGCQLPGLWEFYIHLLASFGKYDSAKKVFFRAVNHCGWSQELYVTAAGPGLRHVFSEKETVSLESMLEQRQVHWLRV
jgi:hypothetical protein